MFVHGPNESAFRHPDLVRANRVARLLALFWGLLAVTAACLASRELFHIPAQRPWRIVATALFAFTPTMAYMSATVTNDTPATLFATLAIWMALRILRLGPRATRLVGMGVLLGLAGLCKVNTLLIGPGILLALYLACRRHGCRTGTLVRNMALVGTAALIVLGPWMLWGMITYADPFGFGTHHDPTRDETPGALPQIILQLPSVAASYLAKYGTASVWANPITYVLSAAAIGVSLSGYLVRRRPGSRRHSGLASRQLAVLIVILGMGCLGLLYWLRSLFIVSYAVTGRLVFFAHACTALLAAYGLYRLSRRWPYGAKLGTLFIVGVLSAALISGPLVVARAFALPAMLVETSQPRMEGTSVEFDNTIRFLGSQRDARLITSGGVYPLSLCWQVIQPTSRSAAYTIKLLSQDGYIVGERTSIHGLGRYPASLWRAGDRFCDLIRIPIVTGLEPAQSYRMILAMLSPDTMATDWRAATPEGDTLDTPVIGMVASPAGRMQLPVAQGEYVRTGITFPALARLDGYTIADPEGSTTLKAGHTFSLTLVWEVTATLGEGRNLYMHLIGPGIGHVLADGIPRHGDYPTWAWTAGERIVDPWPIHLPSDLASGEYSVRLGFYNPETGARLPALNEQQPVPDDSAELLRFMIP